MSTIREYCQRSQGSSRKPLTEEPSSRAAFLEAFPCLNPFSAAALAGLPCSLQQLLRKPLDELKQLAPDVPERSLRLFLCQAAWGEPVRGVHAAGGSPHSCTICLERGNGNSELIQMSSSMTHGPTMHSSRCVQQN